MDITETTRTTTLEYTNDVRTLITYPEWEEPLLYKELQFLIERLHNTDEPEYVKHINEFLNIDFNIYQTLTYNIVGNLLKLDCPYDLQEEE